MNNEEKILATLEQHSKMFEQIFSCMTQMQATQIQMQADISGLQSGQAQMQADISGMKSDITGIKTRLDYDVDVRLKAMNEHIDTILEKLDTLDEAKELAEKTADSVDVIRATVTQHSTSITELKAVQ